MAVSVYLPLQFPILKLQLSQKKAVKFVNTAYAVLVLL